MRHVSLCVHSIDSRAHSNSADTAFGTRDHLGDVLDRNIIKEQSTNLLTLLGVSRGAIRVKHFRVDSEASVVGGKSGRLSTWR